MPVLAVCAFPFGSRLQTLLVRGLTLSLVFAVSSPIFAFESIEFEVREVAGLARRGFPTHTRLKLPRAVPVSTRFRLITDGKPIVAQFRPDRDDVTSNWWLDFQVEMNPNETKRFHVEFGDDVSALPELARGHEITKLDDGFLITHAPYITWKIPADLKRLISSVAVETFDFIGTDSPGLLLRDRQSQQFTVTGTGKIVRQGHMTVALRYEKAQAEPELHDVRSIVDMTLPGPVSWVEVEWTIDDPADKLDAIGLQLNLNLDRSDTAPTLVDFGTTGSVYLSLYPGQESELVAGLQKTMIKSGDRPLWEVLRRDSTHIRPIAAQAKRSQIRDVEGWAHVMDRKKCLALAIDAFARETLDRINLTADGKVTIWREYPVALKATRKHLRFWLHFVYFPPQASAGTSPQQMQTPLEVRFKGQ